jgi:hypothetical protein
MERRDRKVSTAIFRQKGEIATLRQRFFSEFLRSQRCDSNFSSSYRDRNVATARIIKRCDRKVARRSEVAF